MSSRRKQFKPKSAIDCVDNLDESATTAAGGNTLSDKVSIHMNGQSIMQSTEIDNDTENRKRKRSTSDDPEDDEEESDNMSEEQPNNDTLNDIDDNMVDDDDGHEYDDDMISAQYEQRLNQTTANAFDSSAYMDQTGMSQSMCNSTMLLMFKCKVCGKAFKHRRSLNRHVKLHSGEKNFKCPFCTTAFARSDHLKAHIRTHNNSKPYRCSICQCGYSTQAALKVHIAHHHSKSKFKCVLCNDLEFHSQLALEGHLYTKHSKENEITDLNDLINETATINPTLVSIDETQQRTKLTEINNLIKNEENYYENKLEASTDAANQSINLTISPNKPSPQLSKIEQQPPMRSQQQNSYCNLCNARFSNVESYMTHMRNCHANAKMPYLTSILNHQAVGQPQSDTTQYDLNYTKEIQYQCTQCNLSLMKLNDYLQHIKKEHCVEVYRCVLCKQMQLFDNLNLLKEHFFVAHQSNKLETYKCKLCAHTTITIEDLAIHLKNNHNQSLHTVIQPVVSSQKLFKCQFCDSDFAQLNSLNQHIQICHSTQYSCQYCRNTFTNKAQLERHIRIHLSTIDLKCNICDKQFENEVQLSQHKLTHSLTPTSSQVAPKPANTIQCAFCKLPIENEVQFKEHFKRHNNIGQPNQQSQNGKTSYSCIICRQQLTSNNEYLTHMKTHLATVNAQASPTVKSSPTTVQKCSKCPLKFENAHDLDMHMKKIHPIDSIIQNASSCPLSPATTTSSSSSTSSIQGNMKSEPQMPKMQIFLCEICSSKFDSNFKLQTHLLLKHEYGNQPNATFTCPVCDESYNRADLLLQHTQVHGQPAKIYKCTQCPMAFVFKSQLINHSFSHQANNKNSILQQQLTKPIVPVGVNKPVVPVGYLSQSSQPQQAMSQQPPQYVVHTNENGTKTFTCLTCSKTFANQRNLNVHIRIHTNFRPFECDVCKRKFTRRENLRSHMKCHLNLRPFTCSICNRSFRRKSHVTSHIEVHFKSKIHNCIECDKQFEQLDTFLTHLIGDHSIYDRELLRTVQAKQIIDLTQFSNINVEHVLNQPSGAAESMSLSSKPCTQKPMAYNAIQPIQNYQQSNDTMTIQSMAEEEGYDEDEEETSPYTDEPGVDDMTQEENGLIIDGEDGLGDEDDEEEGVDEEGYIEDVNSVNMMNGDNSQEGECGGGYQDGGDVDENDDDGQINELNDDDDEIDYTD